MESYKDEIWAWELSGGNIEEFQELMEVKDWVQVVKWPMEFMPTVAGIG